MSYGFVYVLSNEAMPGIFKIGMTDRAPMQRVRELSNATAIPLPFEIVCYAEVECALEVEREVHGEYSEYRINESREFFRLSHEDLFGLIEYLRFGAINFCSPNEHEMRWHRSNATKEFVLNHFFDQCADPIHFPATFIIGDEDWAL